MMPPLFDPPEQPEGEEHTCERCSRRITATLDALRVRGWVAYGGFSFTGRPLNVRICPNCKEKLP